MDLITSLDAFPSESPPAARTPSTNSLLSPPAPAVTRAPAAPVFIKLLWGVSLLGAAAAIVFGYLAVFRLPGASQQTAAAAIGCLVAIVPYVIARSIQELVR
jgi:hypothetical protein